MKHCVQFIQINHFANEVDEEHAMLLLSIADCKAIKRDYELNSSLNIRMPSNGNILADTRHPDVAILKPLSKLQSVQKANSWLSQKSDRISKCNIKKEEENIKC